MTPKERIGVFGIVATAVGVSLGLCNLLGIFEHSDRRAMLQWTLSDAIAGLKLDDPRAIAFMSRFPPPRTDKKLLGVSKNTQRVTGGPIFAATIGYVAEDGERLFVATLEDVRGWSAETPYPWLSWLLTTIGMLVTVSAFVVGYRTDRRKKVPDSTTEPAAPEAPLAPPASAG